MIRNEMKRGYSVTPYFLIGIFVGMVSLNSNAAGQPSNQLKKAQPVNHTARTSGAVIRGNYKAEFRTRVKTQGRVSVQQSPMVVWNCAGKRCETEAAKFDIASCQKIAHSQGYVTAYTYFDGRQSKSFSQGQLSQCNGRGRRAAPVKVHVGPAANDRVKTSALILIGNDSNRVVAPDRIRVSSLVLIGKINSSPAVDKVKTTPLILLGKVDSRDNAPNHKRTKPLVLIDKN